MSTKKSTTVSAEYNEGENMRLPTQNRSVFRGSKSRAYAARAGVYVSDLKDRLECYWDALKLGAGLSSCPEDVPNCVLALASVGPDLLKCKDYWNSGDVALVCGFVEVMLEKGITFDSFSPGLTTACQGISGCCTIN
jgi:hypothetical protein